RRRCESGQTPDECCLGPARLRTRGLRLPAEPRMPELALPRQLLRLAPDRFVLAASAVLAQRRRSLAARTRAGPLAAHGSRADGAWSAAVPLERPLAEHLATWRSPAFGLGRGTLPASTVAFVRRARHLG